MYACVCCYLSKYITIMILVNCLILSIRFLSLVISIMKRKKSNSFHLAHKQNHSCRCHDDWGYVVNIYDAHFIVYLCAKFMCHVNWWQILFSQLPVDALFCLPTDGTHWMRSNKRTKEISTDDFLDCFFLLHSLPFCLHRCGLHFNFQFRIAHLLSRSDVKEEKKRNNLGVCVNLS